MKKPKETSKESLMKRLQRQGVPLTPDKDTEGTPKRKLKIKNRLQTP